MFHVLIVDDERNIRRAYQAQIEAASDRYRLADSLCSAKDAVMVCHTRPVDLVLMDVNTVHHESGLDAAQQIKAIRPQVKILIHTSFLDERMIQQAQEIGADGLWFKDYSPDPLIDVMDRIMSGGHYWPDELPQVALGQTLLSELTPGERRVLRSLGEYISVRRMAEHLCVEESTVKTHLHNLCMKTGCANKTELLVMAMEAKLLLPVPAGKQTDEAQDD